MIKKAGFRTCGLKIARMPLCCRTFQKCDPRNARFRLHPYKESVPGYHKYKYPRPLFLKYVYENESFFNVCIAVLMFDGNKGAGFGGEL